MHYFANLSMHELGAFLKIIQDSLVVRSHENLFHWLHDEVQAFLPHDILIAAWGDFYLGLVHTDVVSYLPGIRTTEVSQEELLPFLFGMFGLWVDSERTPLLFPIDEETFHFKKGHETTDLEKALTHMRSALVQGIKDERGRHDCLYVVLSANATFEPRAIRAMEILLPYIDVALRQVVHLPAQYPDTPDPKDEIELAGMAMEPDTLKEVDDFGLSAREHEIMHWVAMGKTNPEIGSILNISSFTVKNHLQRIFRKIDVMNRAQAVAKFERNGATSNGATSYGQ
jgi:transcriptional regulator EpsA